MKKDWLPTILALLFSIGFLATLAVLLFFPIPPESDKTITVMIQALTMVISTIVGYIWGSSSGSEKKNETINEIIKKEETPPPAP